MSVEVPGEEGSNGGVGKGEEGSCEGCIDASDGRAGLFDVVGADGGQ